MVRANNQVSERPLPDPRPPFSGTAEQIAEDLARARGLHVDHVFFDLNFAETPIAAQLRLMERLRTAAGWDREGRHARLDLGNENGRSLPSCGDPLDYAGRTTNVAITPSKSR